MTAFSNASLRSTSCSSVTTWDIATEPVSTGRTCSTRSKTRWQQQGAASSSTQAQHTLAKHACHGPIALPMQPRKTIHNWPLGKRGEHHQKPHMRSIPISNHPRLSGCQPDMPAAFMCPPHLPRHGVLHLLLVVGEAGQAPTKPKTDTDRPLQPVWRLLQRPRIACSSSRQRSAAKQLTQRPAE